MTAHAAPSSEHSIPPRAPGRVMRLARMGASFPTRLSFMRRLVRRMADEGWRVEKTVDALDGSGFGHAVWSAITPARVYSLVCFSHDLPADKRTDRVIAEAWDATFALVDGTPTADDIERLRANVPRQEAGRCSAKELILSRANRSLRLFDTVVTALAEGRQPPPNLVRDVGYLMRTTAVYGNGKYGIADRGLYADRPEFVGAYQVEMLAVYLIRCFTHDLVEHLARVRGGEQAVPLAPALRRHLGIGNATGLGMAPFLVGHPTLIHTWFAARETALARVRSIPAATPEQVERFNSLLSRVRRHALEWRVDDKRQMARIEELRADLATLDGWIASRALSPASDRRPWDRLFGAVEDALGLEAQELVAALLVELGGALVDDLADTMTCAAEHPLDPAMPLTTLSDHLHRDWGWALDLDLSTPDATRRFWYFSEEKLEPRLGDRTAEHGADREMALAIARDAQALSADLARSLVAGGGTNPDGRVAEFVLRHPEHRHLVRRVQTLALYPYSEIRDNLIAATCRPVDILRCKLAFFGATKFDPKSELWTRITMFQGAPLPHELPEPGSDDWWLPHLGGVA